MMPDDWRTLEGSDAMFFGAVGWPATVPDHVSLWGSLIKFRRDFDQYINLRPARLFDGVPCPLAGRKPGDIDMFIVRENTEGEYSAVGGVMYPGTEREFVAQIDLHPHRQRAAAEVRVRAGALAAAQDADPGHQEQRHLDLDAVVGRTLRRDGREVPRRQPGTSSTSTS